MRGIVGDGLRRACRWRVLGIPALAVAGGVVMVLGGFTILLGVAFASVQEDLNPLRRPTSSPSSWWC